ncbi:pts sugar transporter subunit iia [Lasius niger]|uniref:Pts sugar transporter subunit iia n=2 Tax=Lasius TaxID=488720 RepID=A0A0J7KHR1_LASNI|nr:pts sugar transporter subunit iia [Lasius niger]
MAKLFTAIPHTDGTSVSDNFKEALTVMDVRGWVKKRDEENVNEESLLSILDYGVVKATQRQELVRLAVSEMSQLHNNTL